MNVTRKMIGAAHDILLKKEIVLSADLLADIYMAMASRNSETESLRQQLTDLKSELKTIGKAIDDPRTDLTMTMSEVIIEQKKQLAAALAATKSKDAALQSAISAHGYGSGDLHDALAIQPDDSALQAFAGRVREQCAQSIQSCGMCGRDLANEIRAIKELPK